MTLYALQALRGEKLNALANKADSVLSVLHDYYCALFVAFAEVLEASGAGGSYAGVLGQKAAEACAKDPAAAIAQYKRIVEGCAAKSAAGGAAAFSGSRSAPRGNGAASAKPQQAVAAEAPVEFSSF
jgi:hypothetical protein